MDLCPEMLSLDPVRMVNPKCGKYGSEGAHDQKLMRGCCCTTHFDFETMQLSNLDQAYGSSSYRSVALFYYVSAEESYRTTHRDIVSSLRGALEELLSYVPAAAGRVCFNEPEGRTELRFKRSCGAGNENDLYKQKDLWGVQFMAAQASISLDELGDVSDARPSLDLLYPSFSCSTEEGSPDQYLPIVGIQLTSFTGGGFTLALKTHHAFVDGYGAALFLRNLCSLARGAGLAVPPDSRCRREVIKPRMPPSPMPDAHTYFTTAQDQATEMRARGSAISAAQPGFPTRFAFNKCSLEALRRRASAGQANLCTRYQALAALLWTARARSLLKDIAATQSLGNVLSMLELQQQLKVAFRVPCNMRGKAPSLSRGYMGNAIVFCPVSASMQELCKSPLSHIVQKIRVAMDSNATAGALQSQIDHLELLLRAGMVPRPQGRSWFSVSSLVGLPFYDTDCGWGRPRYCASPSQQSSYVAIVLDNPAGGTWNVLVVFRSQRERAFFQEEIAEFIDGDVTPYS